MYKPTEEELMDMGFIFEIPYWSHSIIEALNYWPDNTFQWSIYDYEFNLKDKQDLEHLIRIMTS